MTEIQNSFTSEATTFALILTMLGALPFGAAAQDAKPEALVDMLKDGGYVIYIRHAQTERDYADQVTADPANCATQRVLSKAGWQQAKHIGAAIRNASIPIGQVLSSQYCRAWQTADLAFEAYDPMEALNFEPAEDFTQAQMQAMRDRVVPLISEVPQDGTNRVIVGHDDPFEAATGIYPEPQGVAYVLKPEGDGEFEVMGWIASQDWPG